MRGRAVDGRKARRKTAVTAVAANLGLNGLRRWKADHMPALAGVAAVSQRADRHPLHQRYSITGESRELYAPWATDDGRRMALHA